MDLNNSSAEDDSILTLKERHLHKAAQLGDDQSIQLLIHELHVDVNARNALDRTALHLAAGNGHLKCVRILYDATANLEHPDKYGMNALLWAAWFGHQEIVAFLIKSGATLTIKNKNGLTFLHCAAAGGHTEVLDLIGENIGEFNVNEQDEKGQTAMHISVVNNNYSALLRLLHHKCDMFVNDKENGHTPIHTACELDRIECLRILLHHSLENQMLHEAVSCRNKFYYTPLHVCAEENRLDCVKLLMNYQVDKNGYVEEIMDDYNVMMAEIAELPEKKRQQREMEIVKKLDTYYDEDNGIEYLQVTTPLHLAAKQGYLKIVELLISKEENCEPTEDAAQDHHDGDDHDGSHFQNGVALLDQNNIQEIEDLQATIPEDAQAMANVENYLENIPKNPIDHQNLMDPSEIMFRENPEFLQGGMTESSHHQYSTQTSHQILDRDSGHGMDILEHNHIQRNVDSNQGDPMMLHSKFTSNVDFANRSNNQMIDAQTQPTSLPNDPNLMSDIQNQNNHQPKPSHTGSNFHEVQLKKIRKIINARNEQRQTALHLAAFGGHV